MGKKHHRLCSALAFLAATMTVAAQLPSLRPVALTPTVTITGEQKISEDDSSKSAYAFRDIRYGNAERFRKSVLNGDYSYLTNAPHTSNVCPQKNPLYERMNLTMSEDCLYLDMYVPATATASQTVPVIVYCHGGGLNDGFRQIFNGVHLAAAIDVIVVVVGSRLDAFGYLSTEDDVAKGNFGLGDIKLALTWLQQNVNKFGGDPIGISIFGQSTGGGTVSALFLDDNLRSTLRAAMPMSGSAFSEYAFVAQPPQNASSYSDWAFGKKPKEYAKELAMAAGCTESDQSSRIVECLRQVPMEVLVDVLRKLPVLHKPENRFVFVVDGEHIKEPVQTAILHITQQPFTNKRANFVNGFLAQESAGDMPGKAPALFTEEGSYTYEDAKTNMMRYLTTVWTSCPPNYPEVAQRFLDYYRISPSDNKTELRSKLIQILTDSHTTRIMKEAYAYADRNPESKMISQLYRISYNLSYNALGAAHSFEIFHMFGGFLRDYSMPGHIVDSKVVADMRGMLRSLAYEGRLPGPEFHSNQPMISEYSVAGQWTQTPANFKPLIQFWDEIAQTCRQYVPESQPSAQPGVDASTPKGRGLRVLASSLVSAFTVLLTLVNSIWSH